MQLGDKEFEDLFAKIDKNGDGYVDLNEFYELVSTKLEDVHPEDKIL